MITEKALISIEVEKNEHKYEFIMPVGVPFGEAYDVSFEVLNKITEMAKIAKEKARREEQSSETDAVVEGD